MIAWHENLDGRGHFGAASVITTMADHATAVVAADLDGDGDLDVASASYEDDKLTWYENVSGSGELRARASSSDHRPDDYAQEE